MGPEQNQILVVARIEKYSSCLLGQIKIAGALKNKMAVNLVAQAAIQLGPSMVFVLIADSLLSQIFASEKLLSSESFIEITSHISAFKFEILADQIGLSEMKFGSNSLTVSDFQLSHTEIVKI